MIKFPKIEQFSLAPLKKAGLSTILLHGTIKLHGTNSAIGRGASGNYYFQSRSRIISPGNDNYGFATHFSEFTSKPTPVAEEPTFSMLDMFFQDCASEFVCYGEWIGKGIQQKVGVSKLPERYFVIFALFDVKKDKFIDPSFLKADPNLNIYNIWDKDMFPVWDLWLNVYDCEQDLKDIESLTQDIENECPIAKYFGVPNSMGEGVVWWSLNPLFIFKTKGENHKKSLPKVRTPGASEDELAIYNDVVDTIPILSKIEQMCFEHNLSLQNKKHTGDIIRYVLQDCYQEELRDLDKGLRKTYNSIIADRIKAYIFKEHEYQRGLEYGKEFVS